MKVNRETCVLCGGDGKHARRHDCIECPNCRGMGFTLSTEENMDNKNYMSDNEMELEDVLEKVRWYTTQGRPKYAESCVAILGGFTDRELKYEIERRVQVKKEQEAKELEARKVKVVCPRCDGNGHYGGVLSDTHNCPVCGGEGQLVCLRVK